VFVKLEVWNAALLADQAVQLFEEFVHIHLVNARPMLELFELGNLAFETVESESAEDFKRLRIKADYFADGHVFCNHVRFSKVIKKPIKRYLRQIPSTAQQPGLGEG
jgi:hypothetical protein